MTGYKYLASPYTHPEPSVREVRFLETERALAWLLNKGIWTYSPIVHCHQLTLRNQLPPNYEFWHDYNTIMIERSSGVILLKIDGWDTSKGVRAELLLADISGRPVRSLIFKDNEWEYKS